MEGEGIDSEDLRFFGIFPTDQGFWCSMTLEGVVCDLLCRILGCEPEDTNQLLLLVRQVGTY